MTSLSRYEGLTIRKMPHGGYLVTHPDIYTVQSLYFAATTIEEVFAFTKRVLEETAIDETQEAPK